MLFVSQISLLGRVVPHFFSEFVYLVAVHAKHARVHIYAIENVVCVCVVRHRFDLDGRETRACCCHGACAADSALRALSFPLNLELVFYI